MAMTFEELIMEQIMNSLEQNASHMCDEPRSVKVHAMSLDQFNDFIHAQEEKTKKCNAPCDICNKEPVRKMQQAKQVNTPEVKSIYIKNVLFNQPATIVFWSDGTKTVSLCHETDTYSKATGLTICICKKLVGNQTFHDIIEQWCPDAYDDTEPEKSVVKIVADKPADKKATPKKTTTAKTTKTKKLTENKNDEENKNGEEKTKE